MGQRRSSIEHHVLLADYRVEFSVDGSSGLHVEHDIAHGVILVPQKVVIHIHTAHVKVPICICIIASLLVSVDSPIDQTKQFVFVVDDCSSLWLDIEGGRLSSFDLHEAHVETEDWVAEWAIHELSPEGRWISPIVLIHVLSLLGADWHFSLLSINNYF